MKFFRIALACWAIAILVFGFGCGQQEASEESGLAITAGRSEDEPVGHSGLNPSHLRFTVRSSSMVPALYPGDTIIVQPCDSATIEIGDIVTFNPNPSDPNSTALLTHRVIQILDELGGKEGLFFVTKGDRNQSENPPISGDAIIGKVVDVIPGPRDDMNKKAGG